MEKPSHQRTESSNTSARADVVVTDRVSGPGTGVPSAILCSAAAIFSLWAYLDPRFRGPDGFPSAGICIPVSLALGSAAAAVASGFGAIRFGAWLALSIVGQAASLQLIDAGPLIRYQHYVASRDLLAPHHLLATSVLLLQVGAVGLETRRVWARLPDVIRALPAWRLGIGVAAFIVTSAALSRAPLAYVSELALATGIQLLNLATVAVAVTHAPRALVTRVRRWLFESSGDGTHASPVGRDRAVVIAALGCTCLSAFLAFAVYQRHPHLADELINLYEARYMAEGKIAMAAPPDRMAFDVDIMTYQSDRWFSPNPPGWPGVLALGVLFGVPWLVNPVLSGLNVLLVFAVARRLVTRPLARLVAVWLAVSPWYIFLGMSLMSHTLTLTCLLLGALGVLKNRESGRVWWAALGGLFAGAVMLIRPMDALIACVGLGIMQLFPVKGRVKVASAAAFGLAAALAAATTMPYNKELTGRMTGFPLTVYFDELYGVGANALGFGPDRGFPGSGWRGMDPLMGHGLPDVFINAALNSAELSTELLGWSCGSLCLLLLCWMRGRLDRVEWIMTGWIAGVIGFYSLYWFPGGPDFGPRYWFFAIVPCLILSARGLEHLVGSLDGLDARQHQLGARAVLAVVVLTALTLVNYIPWRAVDKYYHYRRARPDIRELAQRTPFGRSLVLVRGNRAPDYASAAVYNPIDLQADAPIYAWDVSPESRRRVLEAYKDRTVWFVDGPTITGNEFRVVGGPTPAAEVLAR